MPVGAAVLDVGVDVDVVEDEMVAGAELYLISDVAEECHRSQATAYPSFLVPSPTPSPTPKPIATNINKINKP